MGVEDDCHLARNAASLSSVSIVLRNENGQPSCCTRPLALNGLQSLFLATLTRDSKVVTKPFLVGCASPHVDLYSVGCASPCVELGLWRRCAASQSRPWLLALCMHLSFSMRQGSMQPCQFYRTAFSRANRRYVTSLFPSKFRTLSVHSLLILLEHC